MQIEIQANDFPLTDALLNHTERRLRFALTCCNDQIQHVTTILSDIKGRHGGQDKCCHLRVVLAGLPDVVVEDIEANLYLAIDRAASRAGRTVVRKIERHQNLPRQGQPLLPRRTTPGLNRP